MISLDDFRILPIPPPAYLRQIVPDFDGITLYEAPAPIAGPCHEVLAPAPILSHASAVIVLGGRSVVNFFQRAELPGVMESDPTDWFRRPKHARPEICGQRQLRVVDDIQG
jgi:hypothetical protein